MSGPFVADDRFEIVVKYIEKISDSGMARIAVITDKDTEDRFGDQVKSIRTQWIQPNWKQANELIRQATYFDDRAGRRELDWVLYRQLILETYMKSWDIIMNGPEGQEVSVPCVKDNINRLDPAIAQELIQQFTNRTMISQEELGN